MQQRLDAHQRKPFRLLALDLDGTLVGSDLQVPRVTGEAIAEFQAARGHVTIATGRTIRTTVPYAEQLQVDVPLICYQGALIRDHRTGETLFHQPISGDLAAEAAALLLDAGIYTHAYVDDELIVPYEGEETRYYRTFSPLYIPTTVVDDLPAYVYDHPPTKLLFISGEREVGRRVSDLQVHFVHRLSVARSHSVFGELTAPGSTKGHALARLAQHLGIPQPSVAAAGDQGNDVDMVAWAGLGMAVSGGPPELLAAADVLIGAPEAGGLGAGIRQYLLGHSSNMPRNPVSPG